MPDDLPIKNKDNSNDERQDHANIYPVPGEPSGHAPEKPVDAMPTSENNPKVAKPVSFEKKEPELTRDDKEPEVSPIIELKPDKSDEQEFNMPTPSETVEKPPETPTTNSAPEKSSEPSDSTATEKPVSSNTPVFVIILAWILLLFGILFTLFSLFTLSIFSFSGSIWASVSSYLSVIVNVGLIVVAFGLRKMKKWALYLLTLSILLEMGIEMYYYFTRGLDYFNAGVIIVGVLILIYLWAINKRFR